MGIKAADLEAHFESKSKQADKYSAKLESLQQKSVQTDKDVILLLAKLEAANQQRAKYEHKAEKLAHENLEIHQEKYMAQGQLKQLQEAL